MKKATGLYSVILGLGIIALWVMMLLANNVPELVDEPITIYFHLCAEGIMGLSLIISGIFLLTNQKRGDVLYLISSGMVIYSVINSAGYYGNNGDWAMVGFFVAVLAITTIFAFRIIKYKTD